MKNQCANKAYKMKPESQVFWVNQREMSLPFPLFKTVIEIPPNGSLNMIDFI